MAAPIRCGRSGCLGKQIALLHRIYEADYEIGETSGTSRR
jgi:hypothetical protein